jgi:hypothetical protein
VSDFDELMETAKSATRETLDQAQQAIFPRMAQAPLLQAQEEVIIRTLSERTGAGVRALWKDYRLVRAANPDRPEGYEASSRAGPYLVIDGAIHQQKDTRDGPVDAPLCNFQARITEEVVRARRRRRANRALQHRRHPQERQAITERSGPGAPLPGDDLAHPGVGHGSKS